MKFAIEKSITNLDSKRVIIHKEYQDYFNNGDMHLVQFSLKVIVQITHDWDNDLEFPFVTDNSSIQFRPKSVFKTTKGYFYKVGNSPIYITSIEVEEAISNIKENMILI